MKSWVLCADDYAVHSAASQGIVSLAQQARLSATSVMALAPHWPQHAPALRELRGQLDVGLHLDWTSEFACAAGHGASLNTVMARALLGRYRGAQVRECIERQLDLFEQHWAAPPDHVDGHQHVQQFAGIREALVQVLQQRYGAQAPYLRVSQAPRALQGVKARIIAAMGAQRLQNLAEQAGIDCLAPLGGIYNFRGGVPGYAQHMAQWMQVQSGGIVMCHPANAAVASDPIGAARLCEYKYLSSAAFGQALSQSGVSLTRGTKS